MRVLVVDDDTAVQRHCREILEAEGFEVVCESSLGSARRFLRHKQADAMLLDLFLPDGCGYDLFRTSPQLMEGLPVVAMTAVYQGSANARLLTMRHPLVSVLAKPIGVSALVEVLREIFEDAYPQAPHWARISQEVAAVRSVESAADAQRSHTGLQPVPGVGPSSSEVAGGSAPSSPRSAGGGGGQLSRSLPWPGGRREAGVPSGAFAALRSRSRRGNSAQADDAQVAAARVLSTSEMAALSMTGSSDASGGAVEPLVAQSAEGAASSTQARHLVPESDGFVSPLEPPERSADVLTGGVMDPPGEMVASGWDISSSVMATRRPDEAQEPAQIDEPQAPAPAQGEAPAEYVSAEAVVRPGGGEAPGVNGHPARELPPTEATVITTVDAESRRPAYVSAPSPVKEPYRRTNGVPEDRPRDLVTPRSGVPRRLVPPISTRPGGGHRRVTSRQLRTLSRPEPVKRQATPSGRIQPLTPVSRTTPLEGVASAHPLNPRDPDPEGLISPTALDPRRVPLQGRLEETPFPAVLTRLARARVTGSLLLRRDRVKKIVFMEEGVPSAVKSNLLYECLGQLLVRERVITESDCQQSVENLQETGRFQGEVLVEMGLLSAEALEHHLGRQFDIKLGDVFGWERGLYQFRPGSRGKEGSRIEPRDPFQVILQAVRSHSPLDRVGIDLSPYMTHAPTLLVTRADLKALELTLQEQDWLRLVDNHRSLGDILSVTGGAEGVYRLFYSLLCLGLLAFRPQNAQDFV